MDDKVLASTLETFALALNGGTSFANSSAKAHAVRQVINLLERVTPESFEAARKALIGEPTALLASYQASKRPQLDDDTLDRAQFISGRIVDAEADGDFVNIDWPSEAELALMAGVRSPAPVDALAARLGVPRSLVVDRIEYAAIVMAESIPA